MIERFRKTARTLVDPAEFARFVASGVTATAGNLAVVWVLRRMVEYHFALVGGAATGLSISFAMSKLFAFRSHEDFGLNGELGRFLMVWGLGTCVYMAVALIMGTIVLPLWLPEGPAEMGGALCGAGSMAVTSYLGHRFFTYRSARSAR